MLFTSNSLCIDNIANTKYNIVTMGQLLKGRDSMMNIRKKITIIMSSVLITSFIQVPHVYANSDGNIKAKANFECKFNGEISIVLTDSKSNKKLMFLTPENKYEFDIDNLKYDKYNVSNIMFYNSNKTKNEMNVKAKYTINSGNLNINQNNQTSDIVLDVHSVDKLNSKKVSHSQNNSSFKNQETLKFRKKINLVNFIFDIAAISILGLIWFMKIRKKEDTKGVEEIHGTKETEVIRTEKKS